jgi:hypothetical protein
MSVFIVIMCVVNATDTKHIKTFVKETLGCTCSEEVFDYIDCRLNIRVNDIVLRNKINIGNRLLIYVVKVNSTDQLKGILALLIEKGRKERDNFKFNRFRLVLETDDIDEIKEVADKIFETTDKDEKVYLHVVSKSDIPAFST